MNSFRQDVEKLRDVLHGAFADTFWGFNKLELTQTCSAMPEQYDLSIDGEPAGYFRLRHGEFRVDYPACGGDELFYSEEIGGDGLFDPSERGKFIGLGIAACIDRWTKDKQALRAVEQ